MFSGTQLGMVQIHRPFHQLDHLVKPNLVSKLLPISFRICRWRRRPSLLGDQPGSMEANAAQECQLGQPEAAEPPRYLRLCSRESPCSKEKGKTHEWERDKATALRGRGGTIHKQKRGTQGAFSTEAQDGGSQHSRGSRQPAAQ